MGTIMDPTLTLQVPFILLSRKDVQDFNGLRPPEEPYSRLVQQAHQTLRKLCPHLAVRLGAFDEQYRQDVGWLLQRMPPVLQNQFGVDERARLGKTICSCAMQLQRSHIPLSAATTAWSGFQKEAEVLFEALHIMSNFQGPVEGVEGRAPWWSVVIGEKCWLRVSLARPAMRQGTPEMLDVALVKKVLTTFAAMERELTLLTTPTALLEYWSLSRFLEHRAICQLGEERRLLWKRLEHEKHLTDQRQDTMYQRGKDKWLSRLEEEESACQRTKGRRREWFDVVNSMDTDELVADMRKFQERGRHLAVSCESGTDFVDTKAAPDNASPHDPTRMSSAASVIRRDHGPRSGQATLQDNELRHPTAKIVFTSHRSTLNTKELVSYVELIATMIHLASTLSCTDLVEWLGSFRDRASVYPDQPMYGIGVLMDWLRISNDTRKFWISELRPLFLEHDQTVTTKTHISQHPDPQQTPFAPFLSHVRAMLASERAYIPTFISRYENAGGFHPTSGRKLYALLLAEEHEVKKRQEGSITKRSEEWLERLGEVNISDANEQVENLDARAPRSPEMTGEEKTEKEKRIRELLRR